MLSMSLCVYTVQLTCVEMVIHAARVYIVVNSPILTVHLRISSTAIMAPVAALPAVLALATSTRPFKTRLCAEWQHLGRCPRGISCNFAHGTSEMKPADTAANLPNRYAVEVATSSNPPAQRLALDNVCITSSPDIEYKRGKQKY